MNKIGLKITQTANGLTDINTINGGTWEDEVYDIREILKFYESAPNGFVLLKSFSKEGSYITLARTLSGRSGDNLAAWVFVPNTLRVPGEDMVKMIEGLKKVLQNTNLSNLADLVPLKDYPEVASAPFRPSAQEERYAQIKIDANHTLSDLLGCKCYQPFYAEYKAVLIEEPEGLRIINHYGGEIKDISAQPLDEYIVFCPPSPKDGFEVSIGGEPFQKNRWVIKGHPIYLTFKRREAIFKKIDEPQTVKEDGQLCEWPPQQEWIVSLTEENISGKDELTKIVIKQGQTIFINDSEITSFPFELSETMAKNAKVHIKKNGYKEHKETHDFVENPKCDINLKREVRVQKAKINIYGAGTYDEDGTVTFESTHLPVSKMKKSPIKGYRLEDGNLIYTTFRERLIGFAIGCGLCIGVLLGILIYYSWPIETKDSTTKATQYSHQPKPAFTATHSQNEESAPNEDIEDELYYRDIRPTPQPQPQPQPQTAAAQATTAASKHTTSSRSKPSPSKKEEGKPSEANKNKKRELSDL